MVEDIAEVNRIQLPKDIDFQPPVMTTDVKPGQTDVKQEAVQSHVLDLFYTIILYNNKITLMLGLI